MRERWGTLSAVVALAVCVSVAGQAADAQTVAPLHCPVLSQAVRLRDRDAGTSPKGQVSELQRFLADYFSLPQGNLVTGYFGDTTLRRVIQFQKEQHLTPASGYVGPLTRAVMALACGPGGSRSQSPGDLEYVPDPSISTCLPDDAQLETLRCPKGETGTITRARGSVCKTGATAPEWVDWVILDDTCSGGPRRASRAEQSTILQARNAYSPELVRSGGGVRMYFSGQDHESQMTTAIYSADCDTLGSSCGAPRQVVDPVAAGLQLVSDPSIIVVPAHGTMPAYYVMYMTGQKEGAAPADSKIYFSVSHVGDGLGWSPPRVLLDGYHDPSALIGQGGKPELYAYGASGTTHPTLEKFALGDSGIDPGSQGAVSTVAPDGANLLEASAYVSYSTSTQRYRMLAETVTAERASQIDYLTSADGLSWTLDQPGVVKPSVGQLRVGTPASFLGNPREIYFASGQKPGREGMDVRAVPWVQ